MELTTNITIRRKLAKESLYDLARKTMREMEMQHVVYSRQDIVSARFKAVHRHREMDFTSESGLIECWKIAHVLTSDESWGSGKSHLVCDNLKLDVEMFFMRLLKSTEPDEPSHTVLRFILNNIGFIEESHFVVILRAYLFGFTGSYGSVEDVNIENTSGVVQEKMFNMTALQLCCHTDAIAVVVLKTLLEAGIEVDDCNDNGDTPLMMAVFKPDGNFPVKTKLLLNYGARIDEYNICFQNPIHLSVAGQNLEGLKIILEARRERMRWSCSNNLLRDFDTRLQERRPLDPDPLHFTDEDHETPLTIAVNFSRIHYKMRIEMIQLLKDAGADGDSDINRETRNSMAKIYTPGVLPSCYGILTCHLFADFVVYMTVHKENFRMELKADFNVLRFCVDENASVLPNVDFDIDEIWMACRNQRFDFAANVDGIDFDVHFHELDTQPSIIKVVGCNEGAAYKTTHQSEKLPMSKT